MYSRPLTFIVFLFVLFTSSELHAQLYIDSLNNDYIKSYISNDTIISPSSGNTIYISGDDKVEFVSTEQIYLGSGFSAGDFSEDGYFRARIANDYYVNDNSTAGDIYCTAAGSSESKVGSSTSPFLSLQSIIDNFDLEPGDVVFIDVGTYNEDITIGSADSGDEITKLIFCGAGDSVSIFTSASGENNFLLSSAEHIDLQKMKLVGVSESEANVELDGSSNNISIYKTWQINPSAENMIISRSGSMIENFIICDNTITQEAVKKSISILGNVSNIEIIQNTIFVAEESAYAIFFESTMVSRKIVNYYTPNNIVIEQNDIKVADSAIFIYGKENAINNLEISSNTIQVDSADGLGVYLYNTGNITTTNIVNANIFKGEGDGLKLYNADGFEITNNYFLNKDTGLVIIIADTTNIVNNSFFNEKANIWYKRLESTFYNKVLNNIFYAYGENSSCMYVYGWGEDVGDFYDMDYNMFFAPNSTYFATLGVSSFSTLSAWQSDVHTIVGNDGNGLHSIYTNPEYKDITQNLDVNILTPAIQKGVYYSGTVKDIYGKQRFVSAPSIGAMEAELAFGLNFTLIDTVISQSDTLICEVSGAGLDSTLSVFNQSFVLAPVFSTTNDTCVYLKFKSNQGNADIDSIIIELTLDTLGVVIDVEVQTGAETYADLSPSNYLIQNDRMISFVELGRDTNELKLSNIQAVLDNDLLMYPQDTVYNELTFTGISEYSDYEIEIFDISENEIFSSVDINNPWDGKSNFYAGGIGDPDYVPSGTYRYILTLNNTIEFKGYLIIEY
jgi:CHU_C Type IX secretion signal domain/Periplasmic copper-binding protein (NosD)